MNICWNDDNIYHSCNIITVFIDPCGDDEKSCPDGSVHVRDPDNNCEFPACPGKNIQLRHI